MLDGCCAGHFNGGLVVRYVPFSVKLQACEATPCMPAMACKTHFFLPGTSVFSCPLPQHCMPWLPSFLTFPQRQSGIQEFDITGQMTFRVCPAVLDRLWM